MSPTPEAGYHSNIDSDSDTGAAPRDPWDGQGPPKNCSEFIEFIDSLPDYRMSDGVMAIRDRLEDIKLENRLA